MDDNIQSEDSWLKKQSKFLGPIFVIWAIYYFGSAFFSSHNHSNFSVADDIKRAAEEYNSSLPEMLNNEIRLDSTNTAGLTWNYYYTFIDAFKSDVEGVEEFFMEYYRSALGNNPCEFWKDRNSMDSVTLNYYYFTNDGYEIGDLIYNKNDCL